MNRRTGAALLNDVKAVFLLLFQKNRMMFTRQTSQLNRNLVRGEISREDF